MGLSIVADYSRSRVLDRAAKKYNSQALEADALHFSTDLWSSSVVIIGLALVWLGEVLGQPSLLRRADALAALVVALIVIYVSYRLGRRAVDALLDTAPHGLAEQIVRAVEQVDDARRVIRARVRGSGNQIFVDLRVAVPRYLSFEASHLVTHKVQAAVHALVPTADVVVHTVPVAENEGVWERIQAVSERGRFEVHNVTTHLTKQGMWIDLDLEVPPGVSFDEAHAMATDLENRLRAEFQPAENEPRIAAINVHIEPRAQVLMTGAELAPNERAPFIERIQAIRAEMPHARACTDINVRQLNSSVYLAFRLAVDAQLSMEQVHGICEEMESRLRHEFPQLGRVMIHAEPDVNENVKQRE